MTQPTTPGWMEWLPPLSVAALAFGALAISTYAPPSVGEMAVVFSPFADEKTVFAAIVRSGGRFVAPGKFGNIAIAYASDPGFHQRIAEAGALFTLAATGLCGPVSASGESTRS